MQNKFAPKSLVPETPREVVEKIYDSGYTEDQIKEIKKLHTVLTSRNLVTEPVTLEEFRNIVIPWQRINRTEAFNLNPEKVKVVREKKVKEPSTRKPRAAKVSGEVKLTKKAIEIRLSDIIFKMAVGEEITEEETTFFESHTKRVTI